MRTLNVLVACEESQAVCLAFRELGHEAWSCDLQECSGGHPEWHIICDCLQILWGGCEFMTQDGLMHNAPDKWDLVIAHPPCTYLSNAGACRLYRVIDGETYIRRDRFEKGLDAKDFFLEFLQLDCVAIENPTPSAVYRLPKPTQIVQPFQYGHPYSKRTCLWLKGLPELKPTEIITEYKPYIPAGTSAHAGTDYNKGTVHGSRKRSKTFPGIAKAMAEQWSAFLLDEEHTEKKGRTTVAIKGMNMPYGCMDCSFGNRYGLVGDCHCSLTDGYYTNNPKPPYKERPDECPLVPVPVDLTGGEQ